MPTPSELVARARVDLRVGLPVVLKGADGAGLIVMSAETAQQDRLAALRDLGEVVVVITGWRAQTLKARAYHGDLAMVVMPPEMPVDWLRDLADPANDLSAPMKGPLATLRSGDATLHRLGLSLAKSARLLPCLATVACSDAAGMAARFGLTILDQHAAARDLEAQHGLFSVAAAALPMEASEAGRLHIFRPGNGDTEHYAIEVGRVDRSAPVLARVHSACFTGDVLGSLKCDCGPQLRTALAEMAKAGGGILLYLNQEGRGIGLANKMRAYSLQDQGFDTVEANHRLGFEDDERDFRIGADLLRKMGVQSINLMTNNPRKVEMMVGEGITVAARVPLVTPSNRFNAHYLATKAAKSGHMM